MPGVLLIQGMSLQFPEGRIVVRMGEDGPVMDPAIPDLRLDLWPLWLDVGCQHTTTAADASAALTPDMVDERKGELLLVELQNGMVAMAAFAFSFDGFYDVVRSALGQHPDASKWRGKDVQRPKSRHAQITETLRFHLKLGPVFTGQLRQFLKELMRFRGVAVHPSSKFETAAYREEIDAGVHPHLIKFSGRHLIQTRAVVLVLLERMLERAAELATPDEDVSWIESGQREVTRLATQYRVTGDDLLAFPPGQLETT